MWSKVRPFFPGGRILPPIPPSWLCRAGRRCGCAKLKLLPLPDDEVAGGRTEGILGGRELDDGMASTRAARCASSSVNTHMTRAATLWWIVVLLSSPMMSIPNSCERVGWVRRGKSKGKHTTISSFLSSNGSDSTPSGLSRSPLMNVPLELFTSLMYIFRHVHQSSPRKQGTRHTFPLSSQISACCLLSNIESK